MDGQQGQPCGGEGRVCTPELCWGPGAPGGGELVVKRGSAASRAEPDHHSLASEGPC